MPMKLVMISIMKFLLLLHLVAFLQIQARNLPGQHAVETIAKSNYGRPSMPPPPAPSHAPLTHEVSGSGHVASAVESSIDKFNIMNNYRRPARSPPPAPRHAPPTHEVSESGLVASAMESSFENINSIPAPSPPPAPRRAPPTHEVSGDRSRTAPASSKAGNSNKKINNNLNNYKRPAPSPPPPPQHAPFHPPSTENGLVASLLAITTSKSSGGLSLSLL